MTTGESIIGVLAIVIGYLLGSTPSAYLLTRLIKGRDIRQIGRGTVGGARVYREVGPKSGMVIILADMAKGAAAVSIAYWVFSLPQLFVLIVGVAAVAGHLWMMFLKFNGGGGTSTSFGATSVILLVYGYWPELAIYIAIIVLVVAITRNAAASAAISHLFLPLIVWLGTQSLPVTFFCVGLGLLMLSKQIPTLTRDYHRAGSMKNLIFHNTFHRNRL